MTPYDVILVEKKMKFDDCTDKNDKLKLLWDWCKVDAINLKQFMVLINYIK